MLFRKNNLLIEVRSDVEGALLGWLPLPPVPRACAFPRSGRYIVDPHWLAVLQGRPIVPWPFSPARILELPLEEWAPCLVVGEGADWRYVIPDTRLAYVCRLDLYDELRACRAFMPCE